MVRIGMGGHNMNLGLIAQAMGGLKDAGKIVGAGLAEMFGDKTQISTINAANMLSYTGDANLGIAKDIWDENINVEYRELTDDNGLYTHSTNTITLSSSLLGGGKEESAKLATVMAHEGSHANGVNIEALAHANGLQTYSAINTMFGLNGDTNFSNQMLAGIMAPENWKENTGDVEHWAVNKKGNLYWDGQFDLVDENGNLLDKANKNSLSASYAQFMGISEEEAKKLFESDELNVSFREGKLLSYNSETGKFDIDRTNDSSFEFETSEKFKASYDFQVNYADKVLEKYNGDMVAALQDYQFNSLMGNTLVSSQIVATMMSGLYDFADAYNDSIQAYGNVGKTKATSQMFNEIAADFDAGIFSNDNAFFKYAKDISPVVGDNRVVSDYYYSDKSLHVKNPDALAIDFGTFGKTAGIVTTQTEIILTNSSFGYTEKGGFNISTYTDLFKKRYVHMQDKSSAYIMLNSLNNSAKTANIWRYSLPSNYQIGNVAGFNDTYAHGSAWEAPHSHTEYTRLK